mgnify:CR=1 FL=1
MFTFVCENELFGRAIYGDDEPYIICLQVARLSDHDIWMSVAPLLVKQCRDTKSLLRFEKFMKRHMCRSKHVRFAIQRFLSDLISEDLFVQKFSAGVTEKHGCGFFEEEGGHSSFAKEGGIRC